MGKWRNAADEMYKAIQERKVKAAARKKKADMEARQILIQSSVNSKIRYYRQRKK